MTERILMALDHSPASERAVDYVGRMMSGRPDVYVHLTHVLEPRTVPAHTKRPGVHVDDEETTERRVLEDWRARLVAAGIDSERVDIGFLQTEARSSAVDALFDMALDQRCDTIVAGRHGLPWYRELFHHHLADEIVKKADGYTVWIVE